MHSTCTWIPKVSVPIWSSRQTPDSVCLWSLVITLPLICILVNSVFHYLMLVLSVLACQLWPIPQQFPSHGLSQHSHTDIFQAFNSLLIYPWWVAVVYFSVLEYMSFACLWLSLFQCECRVYSFCNTMSTFCNALTLFHCLINLLGAFDYSFFSVNVKFIPFATPWAPFAMLWRLFNAFFILKHVFVTLTHQAKALSSESRRRKTNIRTDKAQKPEKGKGDSFCVLLYKRNISNKPWIL